MAQPQVAHWPWDGLVREDSRARRAAADSSLAWEQILSRKLGALSRHAAPQLPERLTAVQTQASVLWAASSLLERAAEPVLELQEQLQEAGRRF
jgi:hypothetical protein